MEIFLIQKPIRVREGCPSLALFSSLLFCAIIYIEAQIWLMDSFIPTVIVHRLYYVLVLWILWIYLIIILKGLFFQLLPEQNGGQLPSSELDNTSNGDQENTNSVISSYAYLFFLSFVFIVQCYIVIGE